MSTAPKKSPRRATGAAPAPAGRAKAAPAKRAARAAPTAAAVATDGAQESEPTSKVLRQFRIVFNSVKAHFQQVERKVGIGGAQVWALAVIRDRPGLGVNDLAQALDVRQPTASNLVKALALQGMVDVRREGPDRRAVQLYLLPEGRRVLRRAPGPFTGVLPQALASLDAHTLQRLDDDLARLIAVLGVDAQGAKVPLGQ